MISTKKIVYVPDAVPPLPVFSQAVISKGHVFVSGNIGCTNDFNVVEGGVKDQTRAALTNILKLLKASGSGLEYVVKVNIYLTDLQSDFVAMNEAYLEFFDKNNLPARTCVGVSVLPLAGAVVEVECVAEIVENS